MPDQRECSDACRKKRLRFNYRQEADHAAGRLNAGRDPSDRVQSYHCHGCGKFFIGHDRMREWRQSREKVK